VLYAGFLLVEVALVIAEVPNRDLRIEPGLFLSPGLVKPSISNSSESLSYLFFVIVSSDIFALARAYASLHCKP
jgi:hypothetical protein